MSFHRRKAQCLSIAPILLLFLPLPTTAVEFAGELFRVRASVTAAGTAGNLSPQAYTPSGFTDFPSSNLEGRVGSAEVASLPAFGGLSERFSFAGGFSLDSSAHLQAYVAGDFTEGIGWRPALDGTHQDRLYDPEARPDEGTVYRELEDRALVAGFNFNKSRRGLLPRTGIAHRPVPYEVSAGLTAKYFYEFLHGDGYEAQNINADAGLSLRVLWGWNPVLRKSTRNLQVHLHGFELLGTDQAGRIGGQTVGEAVDSRARLSIEWEEEFPSLRSRMGLGISKRTGSDDAAGIGAEWGLRETLYLRAGWGDDWVTTGATIRYRFLAAHYALVYHELGTSLYQVSLQFDLR